MTTAATTKPHFRLNAAGRMFQWHKGRWWFAGWPDRLALIVGDD